MDEMVPWGEGRVAVRVVEQETRRSCLRWERDTAVLSRDTIDGVILLGAEGDEPLLLDGVGALVWSLLDDAPTLDHLAEEIARISGGALDVVTAGVESFLNDLAARGVVRRPS